jgi:hypothetical protein
MATHLIRYRVVGREPGLLMSNPRTSMLPSSGSTRGVKKIPTPTEEAATRVYSDADGNFWFPAEAFRSAVIDASSGYKYGRLFATNQFKKGLMHVEETVALIDPETGDPLRQYEIDVRRAVIKGQGVMRARPLVKRWAAVIEFEYDDDFVQEAWIDEQMERAGKVIGIGDYRPSPPKFSTTGKGGRFGRFTVERLSN